VRWLTGVAVLYGGSEKKPQRAEDTFSSDLVKFREKVSYSCRSLKFKGEE